MSKESDQLRQENEQLRCQVAHLERVNAEQQATIEALLSQQETLTEQMALLKKALFSRRRERFLPSPDQKLLFSPEPVEGEAGGGESDAAEGTNEEAEERPRRRSSRKRRRFEFPQFLPVQRVEHRLPAEQLDCPCGCGERLEVISEQVSRQLQLIEARAYVSEEVRYTYGCPTRRGGASITTTQKPANINEKGILGSTVVAWLAQSKFERHLPLYRLQEELHTASGMWFSRSVLCSSLIRAAQRLLPLRDLIHWAILQSFYLRADETTARVLRPGSGSTAQIYLWIYVGDEEHPFQLMDYRLNRSRAGPRAILGDFGGGLLTDGFSGYESLVAESDGRLVDLGCWAHARRKFDESCAVTSHPLAHDALAWIWQLYEIEDRLAEATGQERLQARQRESLVILEQLHERLVEAQPGVRPSSKLAEAIGYVVNRWPAMTRYTTDGRYAIDNNAAERSLRPSVIGRKNYQFFGSDNGGRAACIWYTIIQSARRNQVQVLPYLKEVLVRVPEIVPEYLRVGDAASAFASLSDTQRDQLSELLPNRWLSAHGEHRSEDRQQELDRANERRRQRRSLRRRWLKA